MEQSKKSKPRILAWRNDWGGKGNDKLDLYCGVGYYRIVKPLQYLPERFDAVHFGRLPDVVDENLVNVPPQEAIPYLISKSDIVWMKNISSPAGILQFVAPCAYYKKPLILDMDDDYFAVDELHPDAEFYKRDKLEQTVHEELFRSVTAMTVSTEPLAEVYKPYCSNIHVLPNLHDINDWQYKKSKRKDGRIAIGWMGSQTHFSDFLEVVEVYRRIWNKYNTKIIFLFCGGMPPSILRQIFEGMPKEAYEVHSGTQSILDYFPSVAKWGFDIGLAPLKRSPFNDGKAEGKWMEYASYKIPTVATNFGPYARNIKHGIDGILCDTVDEWVEWISRLIESATLREQIGTAAYNEVVQNRQWKDHGELWGRVFDQYIGKGFERA
jgi:glycosyltransferase involved in cell wall biosynthesis